MTDEHTDGQPTLLFLPLEKTLGEMLREILQLEGYTVVVTHTAYDTLDIIEREGGTYVVLMDNFHVSEEAQHLSKTVFARPELHARVRVVGMAAFRHEGLVDLDAYIQLPPTIDDLVKPIARLCAELQAGE